MLRLPPACQLTGLELPPERWALNTKNRFSPGPADQRNQAALRHPERSIYRCFLTNLAGFIDICRAGPDYADRQDRKKTGLFRYISAEHLYCTPVGGRCQLFFSPGQGDCTYKHLALRAPSWLKVGPCHP